MIAQLALELDRQRAKPSHGYKDANLVLFLQSAIHRLHRCRIRGAEAVIHIERPNRFALKVPAPLDHFRIGMRRPSWPLSRSQVPKHFLVYMYCGRGGGYPVEEHSGKQRYLNSDPPSSVLGLCASDLIFASASRFDTVRHPRSVRHSPLSKCICTARIITHSRVQSTSPAQALSRRIRTSPRRLPPPKKNMLGAIASYPQ
ncbi:hypothetical protein PENSPDRAFT_148238 [Peniophora sp. CONT]|nr:hypothetical protein PENSPDRAFT_148238 [Peniophora sp. CONT]